jgi:signal transduction histidine kinase/CheY-like chemotaxis protein
MAITAKALPINIGAEDRSAIADGLSKLLVDTYTLYLTTRNFHWNVTGPMFSTLHAMFMEQYTELWGAVDPIAELIRPLGHPAPGSYQKLASLRLARDEAARASRAKSEFLANLSHELRTPLNAILGYAQILQSDKNLSERQARGLATVEQAGQHLLALIDEILDLSKIEAGRGELHSAPVALAPFLLGIVNIIRVRVEQKGVHFAYDAGELPATVMADERRLRQVLLNLLGNAAKFTDRGEVRLHVRQHGDTNRSAQLRFEVHDSGIGIRAEDVKTLFQPFQQVGDARRQHGGTGLGLAISRQLVRHMGGDIDVQTEPGRGSVFGFELELATVAEPATTVAHRTVVGYDGERKTVLVVDDVAANRAVLSDMLRPLGFTTVEAENGREGVEKAQALLPDLILMDNVMPVMDGAEATLLLRQMPALRDVPVIAISASATAEGQARALAAGATAFLSKPFRAAQLVEMLETQLGIRFIRR